MKTEIERRIAAVARTRGISFYAAAAVVGGRGRRRKSANTKAQEQLTRLRGTWAWRRDFE